jgi:poly(3-hydroxybutyrate) depolymerase
MIAGITKKVMSDFGVDARRVYVGGISAGGAMADIMAVTYPDLYAAAMVYAGCDYKATANCLGSVSAVPGNVSGEDAFAEMQANAADGVVPRVVPVIVIQGDADPVVPFPNSTEVVHQFLTTDARVTGGTVSAIPPTATTSRTIQKTPPAQSYIIEDYNDGAGCTLAERWIVNGMAHQWSGTTPRPGSVPDAIFNDPDGPDVTTPIVQFFMAHPMPPAGAGAGCYQAPAVTVPDAPSAPVLLLFGAILGTTAVIRQRNRNVRGATA